MPRKPLLSVGLMSDIEVVVEGRALIDGELRYAQIGITEDGRIAAAGSYVSGGERRVDLGTSRIMVPGFIDPHVHMRDPGMTFKEDFGTGTLSAVHAGVTCALDMPNTKPPVTDVASLREKGRILRGKAMTDYGLFVAVTPGINARLLAPLAVGFKLFMGSTTGNILLDDDEELVPAVRDALSTGRRVSVHAEDDKLIRHEQEMCCRDHLRNRPAEAEINAISRLASHFKGSKVNICHITTPEGLALAKAAGFSAEVTLHHLMFEVDRHQGQEYKVNPPIRDKANRDRLMARFMDGAFDMIGTDHAPHTADEKQLPFDEAPSGIPGVETTMPILMEMVRRGDLPLSEAARMASKNPGEMFGIPKGRIAEGFDADLAIFDMRATSKIDVRRLHSRCGHSPYGGYDAVFPQDVVVRGSIQVRDGEFCGEPIGRDVRGLRYRFFGDRGKAGRMPPAVRDVLPMPARGPAVRAPVLQEKLSSVPGEDEGASAVSGAGPQEGSWLLRIPRRAEVHRLRASYGILQAVSFSSVCGGEAPGRARPLMQRRLGRGWGQRDG